jgi:hypothetical protein
MSLSFNDLFWKPAIQILKINLFTYIYFRVNAQGRGDSCIVMHIMHQQNTNVENQIDMLENYLENLPSREETWAMTEFTLQTCSEVFEMW